MIALYVVLTFAGIVAATIGASLAFDGKDKKRRLWSAGLAVGGFLVAILAGSLWASSGSRDPVHDAAAQQGISIRSTADDLVSTRSIKTTAPCVVSLDLKSGKLVLRGTDVEMTADRLSAVCKALA